MNNIEICNLALSRVGCKSISSLEDPTREANVCSSFYDRAVEAVLRGHDWAFARSWLALVPSNEVHPEWRFVYQYPANCIAVRRIARPDGRCTSEDGKDKIPFDIASSLSGNYRVVLTNECQAIAVFTSNVTNTALFDEAFCDALAWRIAAEAAQPLRGDSALSQAIANRYIQVLSGAQAYSDTESRARRESDGTFASFRNGDTVLGNTFLNARG